jgi:hypothetical protein
VSSVDARRPPFPSGPTTNPSLGAAGVATGPSLDESEPEHAEPKNAIDATTIVTNRGDVATPPSFQSRPRVEHGGGTG